MKNYVFVLSFLLASNIFAQSEKSAIKVSSAKAGVNPLLTMGNQAFKNKYQNTPLPTFTLPDINGKTISSNDFLGKKIHINFWSITCKYCIQEFPELDSLKQKYGDDFVYISFAPESTEQVKKIISNHPLNYIVIADAKRFYEELGIDGYPKNFFVGKDGIIKFVTDGSVLKFNRKTKELESSNLKYYNDLMSQIDSL